MYKSAFVFLLVMGCWLRVVAQDVAMPPLPEFSVQKAGKGKVRIGWVNPYGSDLIQINVQRSFDSLRGYRTMFSTPSPALPENGFIDDYVEGTKVYYRIFYMLSSNAYFFSKVKKIAPGFVDTSLNSTLSKADSVSVLVRDSVFRRLPYNVFLSFRDSIYSQTKDSLLSVDDNVVELRPFIPKSGEWHASQYVFTDRTGSLNLRLPDAKKRKYALHVFEADGKSRLFLLKHIPDAELVINKGNFMRAGWYVFELYEDNILKERNKFYIQKEF